MTKTNNSVLEGGEIITEAQEENKPEPPKNTDIVLSVGKGITSNQLTQYAVNYSTLLARIKAFDLIETPYIDEIIISGKSSKLPVEDALKYSYTRGKERSSWFIAGCFDGDIRRTDSLKYRSAIVLDLDNYSGHISELETSIQEELASYTYVAYSTASHSPDQPKVRIIIPVSEMIATEEYKQISWAFVNTLSFKSAVDNASFKANQCMFFSSQINITGLPDGVEQPEYHKWVLDNEAVLLEPSKFKNTSTFSNDAKVSETSSADVIEYKTIEIGQKEVDKSLAEYKASELSYDEWCEVLMALHHYYKGSEKGLDVADKWSKQDADKYKSFEEIKYKWHSFVNQTGDAQVTFLTILMRITDRRRVKFEQEIIQRIEELTHKVSDKTYLPIVRSIAEYCSNEEAKYYLEKIKERTSLGVTVLYSKLSKERRKLKAINFRKSGERKAIYPLDCKLPEMIFEEEYQEKTSPKCTIENFKKLIDAYGIKIVRNVVSKRDMVRLPKDNYLDENGDAARLVRVESLLIANSFSGNKRIAPELCTQEASLNPYNPISEWIKSKAWDGVDRLEMMYDTVNQQQGYKEEDKRLFMRKWFISFVAAMEEPKGVFSKGVLTFQGNQSIGKTSWFKKLLPKPVSEYFLEGATLDPTDKDSISRVTSHALVELGEVDSTMKKDIAALKAFLTSNKDVFRPSYGRVENSLPRRTVFCASVNENEYLVDPTGNSRFWTIPIESLDYKHEIDMQQFWVQILTYYQSGELWWLDNEEEKILNICNEEHLKTCPYTELLLDRYVFPEIKDTAEIKTRRLSATEIYRSLDMKTNETIGAREVARVLKKIGVYRSTDDKKFLVQDHPDYKSSKMNFEVFNQ